MSARNSQPWIYSRAFDCGFVLAPAWIITAVLLAFPSTLAIDAEVSPLVWLFAIVCVDVAHVYSTLYRTYFDREELDSRPGLYIGAPLIGFVAAVLLYSVSAAGFWTVLAYLAVFHFVRQQYGLLMIYARADQAAPQWARRIDQATIYVATLYPLIYWHTHLPTSFHWFIDGDFLALPSVVHSIALPLYAGCLVAYLMKEIAMLVINRTINIPRNLLVGGTIASWYVGIVVSRGDLGFTLANVIAHGIPYIALIWLYGANKRTLHGKPRKLFAPIALPIFVSILVAFAYIEEGLWDGLVWRDHLSLFAWASPLPTLTSHAALSVLVPLLALPQITHYILDGFIWRLKNNADWQRIVFHHSPPLQIKS